MTAVEQLDRARGLDAAGGACAAAPRVSAIRMASPENAVPTSREALLPQRVQARYGETSPEP